jgi:hypothetical protein
MKKEHSAKEAVAQYGKCIRKLGKAKMFMPEYHEHTIYGAVAWISSDAECERMAEKQWLSITGATGSSSSTINDPEFRPHDSDNPG